MYHRIYTDLVHPSYVHGIMDGEVIEDVASGKAWARSFHIV